MIITNQNLASRIEDAIETSSAEIAKKQLSEDRWDDENTARLEIAKIIRRAVRES